MSKISELAKKAQKRRENDFQLIEQTVNNGLKKINNSIANSFEESQKKIEQSISDHQKSLLRSVLKPSMLILISVNAALISLAIVQGYYLSQTQKKLELAQQNYTTLQEEGATMKIVYCKKGGVEVLCTEVFREPKYPSDNPETHFAPIRQLKP